MFIQSLKVDSLKLTLMSLYETRNVTTLSAIINEDIHLEEKAKLFENPEYPGNLQQRSEDIGIGHVDTNRNQYNQNGNNSHNQQNCSIGYS